MTHFAAVKYFCRVFLCPPPVFVCLSKKRENCLLKEIHNAAFGMSLKTLLILAEQQAGFLFAFIYFQIKGWTPWEQTSYFWHNNFNSVTIWHRHQSVQQACYNLGVFFWYQHQRHWLWQ